MNIQQRVFEKVPLYPVPISTPQLRELLPCYEGESVREAIKELCRKGYLELIPGTRFRYRRVEGVSAPEDGRGWPKGKPRCVEID